MTDIIIQKTLIKEDSLSQPGEILENFGLLHTDNNFFYLFSCMFLGTLLSYAGPTNTALKDNTISVNILSSTLRSKEFSTSYQ